MKTRMLRSRACAWRRSRFEELGTYESQLRDYLEGLNPRVHFSRTWRLVRDFSEKLEFFAGASGADRKSAAEISSLKRNMAARLKAALEHLARIEDRLRQVEHAGERED